MLKGNNKYYLLLLLLFALMVWAEYNTPKPIDWRRTYASQDKIPFGCNAFYRLLNEDVFKNKTELEKQTPFNVLQNISTEKTAYIFINDALPISELDCKYLLSFVEKGNEVLFVAQTQQNSITDSFKIETKHHYSIDTNGTYKLKFCNTHNVKDKGYTYKKSETQAHFSFDTARVSVLAINQDSEAVFLKTKYGKGHFYFSSTPDVFANYFVVNNPNREFAYKAFSYLQANTVLWDEYYKSYNTPTNSPLQFIFGNDSLYTAYLLACMALLIFMIFGLKRRQRAIAIVEPLANTTLEFVEVIGSVYYNTSNHKIIAEEKIISFYEFLRSKFSITTRKIDEETMFRISKLSTIPIGNVKKVFSTINYILLQSSIDEKDLIELNTVIENFYKLNKR